MREAGVLQSGQEGSKAMLMTWRRDSRRNGPTVYGSGRPTEMIRDLVNGTDSLDIVVLGDSNTGSGGKGGNGFCGYHNGFAQALHILGAPVYATPVYPAMNAGSALSGWRGSAQLYAPTGNLANGNTTGGGTSYSVWTPGTSWVRYGNYATPTTDGWAYIASGTYGQQYNGVELDSTHPLNDATLTLYYRVRYGTFTASGGSFQPRIRAYDGSPVYATPSAQSTQGAAYDFKAADFQFTVQNPVEYLHASWSGGAGSAVGPCAIHSQSIYCRRKGWAVTSHGYMAGADSATIDTVISGIGSTLLRTHLQELRERQIAAGGSGRVLLVTHSGINGTETANAWTTCHKNIWNTYKSAWSALGYPAGDLAIVSFVGFPKDSTDNSNSGTGGNLVAVRAAANTMASDQGDMTVVDVKKLLPFSALVYGTGWGTSYFQRYSNLPDAGTDITVHLSGGGSGANVSTSDGYTVASSLILQALLGSA